jgi:hypothetical protein
MGGIDYYAARIDSIIDAVYEGPKFAECVVKNS